MACPVGAEESQVIEMDGIPFEKKLMDDACHVNHILEDQSIGQQVAVFDAFLPFNRIIGGDEAVTTKGNPFAEVVIGLDFVGGNSDLSLKRLVGDEA